MSDNDFNSDYPSTERLSMLLKNALWCFAGGFILVGCRFLAGKLPLAIGAGVIICAVASGWLMASNPGNKRTGSIMLCIGILVILSGVKVSILPVITGVLLSIITMGLFTLGIRYLVMYFFSQNKR